ncbi:2656_t:CDS:1 [Ambispora gerdemannii]|uniref:2656_t:CDS:1 n=1 Tax=Ambispora gerdemannii TaxID=144530 RepID=A0A9N9FPB3_9GLOM|nr:2656_t:CDS:1 [Ambispora gerdemannii]
MAKSALICFILVSVALLILVNTPFNNAAPIERSYEKDDKKDDKKDHKKDGGDHQTQKDIRYCFIDNDGKTKITDNAVYLCQGGLNAYDSKVGDNTNVGNFGPYQNS